MLVLGIIISVIVGHIHMNKLIHNQPNKKQINKRNAIYALIGCIFFIMISINVIFGVFTGMMFGLIVQNAYYEFKIK